MGDDCDIVIVGGGLAGATLTCALAATGFRVALLEARPLDKADPGDDGRSIALSFGSRRILSGVGLWSGIASVVTPIETIHISERGCFGATRLNANEEGVEALGYVVCSRDLSRVAYARLACQQDNNVQVIAQARVRDVTLGASRASVTFTRTGEAERETPVTLHCRLLVVADGARSETRRRLNIGVTVSDYAQTAIVARVASSQPHAFAAFERFTDTGPLALLPLDEGHCSLIWTHTPEGAQAAMRRSNADFRDALQACFGYRLGRFREIDARQMVPLQLSVAHEWIARRAALIGNAAHSLHPVAGQGFNLALRDVAQLAELLSAPSNDDPGEPTMLAHYARLRRRDLRRTVRFTDALARLFSNPFKPIAYTRTVGLLALGLVPPLRHRLARQAMGLSGHTPRLTSGLTLAELH